MEEPRRPEGRGGARVLILYLVYWLLPNGPTPRRQALAAAILAGLAVEAARYCYFLVWPWLDLRGA